MPVFSCKVCGKKIYLKPGRKDYGTAKYCSKKCQYLGESKEKPVDNARDDKKNWRVPYR